MQHHVMAGFDGRDVHGTQRDGAIARGYRSQPYPGAAMLRRLAERKVPVIITSDCHDARYLDCGFDDAQTLAKACGFRTAWQMRGDALEEFPL